jgi:3-(3-hydroxy-phenyl)propionate hydroxylase
MNNKKKYDVVISGYGPLGQICALTLSHFKISTVVIERNKDINPKPRATTIDSESLRFLYTLDIFKKITEIFNIPEFLDYVLPNGKIVQRSIVTDTADGYPNLVTFHQPDLEKKLREKVQKSKYVDLYDEHEFISSIESNEKIDVKCKNLITNKLIEISSRFVLA